MTAYLILQLLTTVVSVDITAISNYYYVVATMLSDYI